jgi:hypothetical protein
MNWLIEFNIYLFMEISTNFSEIFVLGKLLGKLLIAHQTSRENINARIG